MYVDMFLNKHPNLEKIVINKLRQISFDPFNKACTIVPQMLTNPQRPRMTSMSGSRQFSVVMFNLRSDDGLL